MREQHEIQALRDELAELRAEVARLGTTQRPQPVEQDPPTAEVSRRGWMKAAAGVAVGGTALALSATQRAAAADGDSIRIGNSGNTATLATTATKTGTGGGASFLFRSGTEFSAGGSDYPSALAGWAMLAQQKVGVYGYSNQDGPDAYGVIGAAPNPTGIGVYGRGGSYGLATKGSQAAIVLEPSTSTPPPSRSNAHIAGEIDVSGTSPNLETWVCVLSGTPGTWRKVGGNATAGALHPIDPTRVYDSRLPVPTPGTLSSGANRLVSLKDSRNASTGAVLVANVVPAGATAVAYNLTIDATVGRGHLAVAPGGSLSSPSSSINWISSNLVLANAGIVKLDSSRQVKVFAGGAGSTHFIIDITGYYL